MIDAYADAKVISSCYSDEDHTILSGCYVWYADITELPSITSADWDTHLSVLSSEDRERVTRFRLEDDRKRALVSLLLQRALIRAYIEAADDKEFDIQRTREV